MPLLERNLCYYVSYVYTYVYVYKLCIHNHTMLCMYKNLECIKVGYEEEDTVACFPTTIGGRLREKGVQFTSQALNNICTCKERGEGEGGGRGRGSVFMSRGSYCEWNKEMW